MKKIVNIVSLETLRNEYGIDINANQEAIMPTIYTCQRFIIRPMLDEELYDSVLNYIELVKASGETSRIEKYETLINEYLAPIIAYYVKSEMIFDQSYKLRNHETEPNSDRFNELLKISKHWADKSESFVALYKDYACDEGISPGDEYIFNSSIFLDDTSYMDKGFQHKWPIIDEGRFKIRNNNYNL